MSSRNFESCGRDPPEGGIPVPSVLFGFGVADPQTWTLRPQKQHNLWAHRGVVFQTSSCGRSVLVLWFGTLPKFRAFHDLTTVWSVFPSGLWGVVVLAGGRTNPRAVADVAACAGGNCMVFFCCLKVKKLRASSARRPVVKSPKGYFVLLGTPGVQLVSLK